MEKGNLILTNSHGKTYILSYKDIDIIRSALSFYAVDKDRYSLNKSIVDEINRVHVNIAMLLMEECV